MENEFMASYAISSTRNLCILLSYFFPLYFSFLPSSSITELQRMKSNAVIVFIKLIPQIIITTLKTRKFDSKE